MAKHLFDQPSLTLNGFDVGADVFSAELVVGRRAAVDVTGLADTFDQFLVPNIRGWGIRLDYFNNLTGTSASPVGITDVLHQVWNSTNTSGVALVLKQTTNIRSVTNNEWTGQVQIDGDFQPIAGGVAEADKGSITLKGLSTLTWLTSSS
jgi:hypothetical protein